MKAITKLIICR